MLRAREEELGFGEVGGWAVADDYRNTLEPVRLLLAMYALLELLGGCTGVATATSRNNSSGILKRVGLRPFEWDGAELPPYYDAGYGCQMEALQFDSRTPTGKYRDWINDLTVSLLTSPVIARGCSSARLEFPDAEVLVSHSLPAASGTGFAVHSHSAVGAGTIHHAA